MKPTAPTPTPDRESVVIHIEIIPQEDGSYGVTFALPASGGSCVGDATLDGSFGKAVRKVKSELRRLQACKDARRVKPSALKKARDEGKLSVPLPKDLLA